MTHTPFCTASNAARIDRFATQETGFIGEDEIEFDIGRDASRVIYDQRLFEATPDVVRRIVGAIPVDIVERAETERVVARHRSEPESPVVSGLPYPQW